ncbi:MAG: radical SAM protein [Pseudomonadales bacterium]|nr:radical SAM protein [Pseudomonadales bacterium]
MLDKAEATEPNHVHVTEEPLFRNAAEKPEGYNEIKLTNKLQQKSIVKHISTIDWKAGSEAPIVVEFDPTTACNLHCPDCISGDLLNQGAFERERIRDLTREMVDAGVKAVILIGGGEPLSHPEVGWIIEYLGRHGVKIGITTNGILINRYMDQIAEYVDWCRISMDAGTAETFQKIRPHASGKSKFDLICDNMRELGKRKKGRMGYSFMIYSEGQYASYDPNTIISDAETYYSNAHEIAEAAQVAKTLGCDYFEVKPMYDVNHYAIAQAKPYIDLIRDQVEAAKALATEDFRVLQAVKLQATLAGERTIEEKSYTRCAVSELRTLVTPSGTYVCPYFRGKPDKELGSLHNQSFKEMWAGEQRASVMEKLNPSQDCRMHCIRHDSNLILEDMISGKPVPMVEDFDLFI